MWTNRLRIWSTVFTLWIKCLLLQIIVCLLLLLRQCSLFLLFSLSVWVIKEAVCTIASLSCCVPFTWLLHLLTLFLRIAFLHLVPLIIRCGRFAGCCCLTFAFHICFLRSYICGFNLLDLVESHSSLSHHVLRLWRVLWLHYSVFHSFYSFFIEHGAPARGHLLSPTCLHFKLTRRKYINDNIRKIKT